MEGEATGRDAPHLTLVHGGAYNNLLARRTPLVHALVRTNVADAVGIDLQQRVVAELRADQRWRCAQEAGIGDLKEGDISLSKRSRDSENRIAKLLQT